MFAFYITHPQVLVNPDIPVPRWGLSETGRNRTSKAALLPWVQQITSFVSSDEVKAVETTEILAAASGTPIKIVEAMGENDRSSTGFLYEDAFQAAANWFFAHPHESFQGWERAIDAQHRIVTAVDAVLSAHDPETPIAFIGHGGVGTLLKCHLGQRPISRLEDQPDGGGNLFAFSLATRQIACDWTPMETREGWQNGVSGT